MKLEIQENIEAIEVKDCISPDEMLNLFELEIINHPQIECPLIHRFTPGLYMREIFMPKGTLITSVLHLTTHPFFVMKGDVSVWYHDIPVQRYKAPYTGITQAGTRRILLTHEDTTWTTVHVTDLEDPDEIVKSVANTNPNPYIKPNDTRANMWSSNRHKLKNNNHKNMLNGELK
jgi:hypothetical protein